MHPLLACSTAAKVKMQSLSHFFSLVLFLLFCGSDVKWRERYAKASFKTFVKSASTSVPCFNQGAQTHSFIQI